MCPPDFMSEKENGCDIGIGMKEDVCESVSTETLKLQCSQLEIEDEFLGRLGT